MADIAARREARRRRILENSENRLQIISGLNKAEIDISGDEPLKKDNNVPHPKPLEINEQGEVPTQFVEKDVDDVLSKDFSEPARSIESFSTHETHTMDPLLSEKNNISFPENLEQKSEEVQSLSTTILSARLHLVGLALIVRFLLSLNFGYLFGESIFVPLGTVQLVKYFGIASHSSNATASSGLLGTALILSGISPQQIHFLNKTLGVAKDVLQDFYIYFFSFIVAHVLLDHFFN